MRSHHEAGSGEDQQETMAERARHARERAGMTQVELARRLNVSQTLISQAECGRARIGQRYLRRVLVACGVEVADTLAESTPAEDDKKRLPRDWVRDPRYCSGLDPDTLVPVRRASRRDLELLRTYPRWRIWAQIEAYSTFYKAAELEAALRPANSTADSR